MISIFNGSEKLAWARIYPATAAKNKDYLMVADRKVGNFYGIHETFGCKMNIIRKLIFHLLI